MNGNKIFSQFIHLASFSEKDNNYYVPKPCINLGYQNFCKNCIEKEINFLYNAESRAICIYRISLLKLLKKIFSDIKNNIMENIDIYEEDVFVKGKCKKEKYINIRYLEGNIYYYIKLAEIKDAARGDYYRIMCAYPVFRENTKRELNRMFGKVKRN